MQVYANGHSGESIKTAEIIKDTAVRYQGGVKNEEEPISTLTVSSGRV